MADEPEGDAPPTLNMHELATLRAAMRDAEPDWVHLVNQLERALTLVLPLCEGSVQAVEARALLDEHRARQTTWQHAADAFYAAFDQAGYPRLPDDTTV